MAKIEISRKDYFPEDYELIERALEDRDIADKYGIKKIKKTNGITIYLLSSREGDSTIIFEKEEGLYKLLIAGNSRANDVAQMTLAEIVEKANTRIGANT